MINFASRRHIGLLAVLAAAVFFVVMALYSDGPRLWNEQRRANYDYQDFRLVAEKHGLQLAVLDMVEPEKTAQLSDRIFAIAAQSPRLQGINLVPGTGAVIESEATLAVLLSPESGTNAEHLCTGAVRQASADYDPEAFEMLLAYCRKGEPLASVAGGYKDFDGFGDERFASLISAGINVVLTATITKEDR